MTKKYKIAFLNGDGIGAEVVPSARSVLEASALKNKLALEILELPIGTSAYKSVGRTLPPQTVETLRECQGWLLGPLQAGSYPKDDLDYPMSSGKIRKTFDLFANIRPFRNFCGVKSPLSSKAPIDFVIVRENTEDFYPDRNLFKGYGEFWTDKDTVLSLRVITRRASSRIAKTAFALANQRPKKRLAVVHKSNVLIEGDGLFLEEAERERRIYPKVSYEETLVDSMAMKLIQQPQHYDVILTTNLFGDILSDEAAALVGGLGLAPSLNAGDDVAMAQGVHGIAPDIAGKGISNPTAEILSVVMMLEWLFAKDGNEALIETATSIRNAIELLLSSGDRKNKTIDLGGNASTKEFTSRVVEQIEKGRPSRRFGLASQARYSE
jgi:3-isopropylmalate dehydrogenase